MKVLYYCHNCGDFIDELNVDKIDEERMGFNVLTEEEKQDIMKWSQSGNMLYVGSVCDNCYEDIHNQRGDDIDPYYEDRLDIYSAYTPPKMH